MLSFYFQGIQKFICDPPPEEIAMLMLRKTCLKYSILGIKSTHTVQFYKIICVFQYNELFVEWLTNKKSIKPHFQPGALSGVLINTPQAAFDSLQNLGLDSVEN